MAKSDIKKRTWRDKYRFSVINDATFEEVWRIRMTRYSAFILISLLVLFIIGATTSLIAFTNLREFIPGYPDVVMRKNILMSAIHLDSLDRELALRDKYFANLSAIIQGKEPPEIISYQDANRDYTSIDFTSSPEDSMLRARIEKEEQFNLTLSRSSYESVTGLLGMHFFPPVKIGRAHV